MRRVDLQIIDDSDESDSERSLNINTLKLNKNQEYTRHICVVF
jgi:hypothetical protein